jgi:2-methylisocitrate lyase-like PEP mutase family enzyme
MVNDPSEALRAVGFVPQPVKVLRPNMVAAMIERMGAHVVACIGIACAAFGLALADFGMAWVALTQ